MLKTLSKIIARYLIIQTINVKIYIWHRIENRRAKKFSIAFIDIDDFKDINDTFGHYEGDKALVNIVHIIKNILRDSGFIARYGGDEFILILNVESPKEVESMLFKISEALTAYNKNSNLPYELKRAVAS